MPVRYDGCVVPQTLTPLPGRGGMGPRVGAHFFWHGGRSISQRLRPLLGRGDVGGALRGDLASYPDQAAGLTTEGFSL